jgi:O-antigen/teichoic acid export membrane protein
VTLLYSRLRKDLLIYGLMSGITKSASLILLPILTRQFTAEEYGSFDLVLTLSILLGVIMTLSLESAVMRFWNDSEDRGIRPVFLASVIVFIGTIGIFIVIALAILGGWISDLLFNDQYMRSSIILAGFAAWLQALSIVPQTALRMQRRVASYNVLLFIQAMLFVVLALVAIYFLDLGIAGVMSALVISHSISLAVGLFLCRGLMSFEGVPCFMQSALKYSAPLMPAVLVNWVNNYADRVLLLLFVGVSAVGIYAAITKIAGIVGIAVYIFRQAWAPLSVDALTLPIKDRNDFFINILNVYIILMFGFAVFVMFSVKATLHIVMPVEYHSGFIALPWLAAAIIIHGAGSITNLGMMVTKRTFGNSVAAFIGASMNVALGFFLIPMFGINGAALGSVLAELTFMIILWWLTWKYTKIYFNWKLVGFVIASYSLFCIFFINNTVIYNV